MHSSSIWMVLYMGKNCQCRGPHCHEIECNAIYCAKHEHLLVLCRGILLFVLVQRRIQKERCNKLDYIKDTWFLCPFTFNWTRSIQWVYHHKNTKSLKFLETQVNKLQGAFFTGLGNLNAELGACGFLSLNLSLFHFRYFTNIQLLFISSVNFCCLDKLKSICLHLLAL